MWGVIQRMPRESETKSPPVGSSLEAAAPLHPGLGPSPGRSVSVLLEGVLYNLWEKQKQQQQKKIAYPPI